MDSIDFDNVKVEKTRALNRYHRLRRIGRLFRAAEVCVALLFLSWTFSRLPIVLQISADFLRRLTAVVSSHLFMFLLGNSIVITLLAKSTDRSSGPDDDTFLYDAFVRSGEHRVRPLDENQTEEIIVFDDKQVIVTETNSNSNSKSPASQNHALGDTETESNTEADDLTTDQPKIYGRSKSDISVRQIPEIMGERSLRRSETEKYREIEETRDYPEDKLSNEEFQKTIEAFIEKQLKFRRRESLAVVVHYIN